MSREVSRRQFIAATTSAGVGLALTGATQAADKPAVLGGKPVRMTGFQGALLLSQMPARMYEGCTRNAYHLYMFRYRPEEFSNLPRNKFVKALMDQIVEAIGKIRAHAPALASTA